MRLEVEKYMICFEMQNFRYHIFMESTGVILQRVQLGVVVMCTVFENSFEKRNGRQIRFCQYWNGVWMFSSLFQMSLLNLRFLYFSNSTSTSKLNQGLHLTSDMTFKLLGYIPYGLDSFSGGDPSLVSL